MATPTNEVAKILNLTAATVRRRAKALGIEAEEVQQTGKRGRPADLWSDEQIEKIKAGA